MSRDEMPKDGMTPIDRVRCELAMSDAGYKFEPCIDDIIELLEAHDRLASSLLDGSGEKDVQPRSADGGQCNEQSGKQLSPAIPTDPVKAFAYLVSKCASGLLMELVSEGKSETKARNLIIHCFLDFAAGEACRIACREGREPDPKKWAKAVDSAFERAVKRAALPSVANTDTGDSSESTPRDGFADPTNPASLRGGGE